jgi:AGZA family xanthine/uracil permease-like MFS transporter
MTSTPHPIRSKPVVPWWVAGDFDGFFALFLDNLLLLMLIAALCPTVCGLPLSLVFGRILPGAAFSILVGNLFYGWQARKLALKTGRTDVTAIPYGINTISVISFCFYIMGPVYAQTHDADLTWKMGLFACFVTGVIETAGAFCADWLRKNTPRAALLCPLAGLALTFLASSFSFQLFAQPLVGLVPMLLILIAYGARLKLPGHVPAALVAVFVGLAMVGFSRLLHLPLPTPPSVAGSIEWTPPVPVYLTNIIFSAQGWKYFSVILPIGILGVLSSIQILDSAEASGDRYETRSSLLMNGVGTLCASFFGSAFTTALYIGHPAWKGLGARSAYSTVNGIAIMLLCLFGGMTLVVRYIPLVAGLGIMLWIGLIMMVQAFQAIPRHHAPAVAIGLIPCLAGWVLVLIQGALGAANASLFSAQAQLESSVNLSGIVALSQGSLISSMILGALVVFIIERKFLKAAGWALGASVLSFFGLIHAGKITPAGVESVFGWAAAPEYAAAYLFGALVLVLCDFSARRGWIEFAGKPSDVDNA